MLLEQTLGRNLVSLVCRQHVMELIVARVFNNLMEASRGPGMRLFKRFAELWTSNDKHEYENGVVNVSIASQLAFEREDLLTFISCQQSKLQPHDDYRELLRLAQLFLGANIVEVTFIILVPYTGQVDLLAQDLPFSISV